MISKLIPQVQLMLHIFHVFLLHEANNLIDAQLADFFRHDVTKLN